MTSDRPCSSWARTSALAFLLLVGLSGLPARASTAHQEAGDADLRTVRDLLDRPDAKIDLARAKLTIDHLIDPTIDVTANLRRIDAIVATIRKELVPRSPYPGSMGVLEALKTFVYRPGPWNDNVAFGYDLDDPMGQRIQNKLLSNYLATKKGNCVSMPILLVLLGQRLGLDVTLARAPDHLFVKYRDETGTWFNVEATSGGGITSDAWIGKNMPMTPESMASGIYLRPLTKKEAVVAMLDALMEFYGQRDQQDRRVALAKIALDHFPKDYLSMLQVSAGYGHMLLRESAGYRSWGEVPESLRPRFKMLNDSVRIWREKAEALGWREPSAETDARYMERVSRAKAGQGKGGAE